MEKSEEGSKPKVTSVFNSEDKKPISQFFSFLDTTAALLKETVTRYIKVSDNAWRALLGVLFILLLWLSGDLQKFIFMIITTGLSILIIIDIAIDNWGKIFRAFRHEKTFAEIDVSSPTSVIQTLSKYNVVGDDILELLKFLKKKNWVSMRMVDTLLTQQHLDDYAVNELLTANLSKKDLLRIIKHFHNSVNEDSLKQVLTKWDYSADVVKTCLMHQISSIELLRVAKNIDRKKYNPIENLCPIKPLNKHWAIKPFRIIFLFGGLITSYLLFLMQQNESFRLITPQTGAISSDAIGALTIANVSIALITSIILWALLYLLSLPLIKFIYKKIMEGKFEKLYKRCFSYS